MLRLFCFSAQLRPAWRSPSLAQAKPSRNGRCLREAAPCNVFARRKSARAARFAWRRHSPIRSPPTSLKDTHHYK